VVKLQIKYRYIKGPVLVFLALIAFVQTIGHSAPVRAAGANQALNAATTKLPNERLDVVAFSPDGNTLVSTDSEGQILIWDVISGQLRMTLPGQFASPVIGFVFSQDGNTLASINNNSIRLWDVTSGNPRLTLPKSDFVTDMAFSPDGKSLAAVGQDSRITLWDSQSGSVTQVITSQQNGVNAIAFSPDSKILAIGGRKSQIALWNKETGLNQLNLPGMEGSAVADLLFSPDGKSLAAVEQGARITLWDSQSGSTSHILTGHQNGVKAIAFSPDSNTLATGGQDAQIKLWDRATGMEQASLSIESGAAVTGLAFNPDGKTLASMVESEPVFLWDLVSQLPQLLTGHTDWVDKLAFSSSQDTLASVGKAGQVVVWDLTTGSEQMAFDVPVSGSGSQNQVNSSALSSPALDSAANGVSSQAASTPQSGTMQSLALAAADSCLTPVNLIVAENCKPGNPSTEWDVVGAGDLSIQGFATDISVNRGQTVEFKIKTDATNYRLDIYRMGYYGGSGARKVDTVQPSAILPQSQPTCLSDSTTGLIDCGNWAVSAAWSVPADATSGIYFARLVRTDTGGASHIVFIVRDDTGNSNMLFKTSDTTWQAYNDYGGNSLYVGSPAGRAYKVSYNRPFNTRGNKYSRAWLFGAEYPMVRWMEANGYDISYFTSVDADFRGSELLEHRVILSVGHDEYWSGAERANVEAARNAGVNLAFFSANEVFWKTRWEPSIDGSGNANRTLVSYKETHANAKIDPLPNVWTGTWRDPRFSPPADGGRPENQLTGTIYTVNCCQNALSITVPEAYSKIRFWRDTSIATMAPGGVAILPRGVLGYEWDEPLYNGFQPAGLAKMSSTKVTLGGSAYLFDYGSTYVPGTATHSLTLYRHSSGALVFGSGTIRWSWGLDGNHDFDSAMPSASTTPDVRMQQATINLFADMGVQPGSLQTGLVAASQSTDTTSPVSSVTSPVAGSTIQIAPTPITITGTAADTGGGVVANVEVSDNGGTTWYPATGGKNWSYVWTPNVAGSATIKSRAVDDSGNVESPGAGINVTVNPCTSNCTLWPSTATPGRAAATNDPLSINVGVKFKSDVSGVITGIRFYKGTTNTGTHVGALWSSTGTKLAEVTFINETASGWQQANFATPVAIAANTVYVASYLAPNGNYAYDYDYFTTKGIDTLPLHAIASNSANGPNGVELYSTSLAFPNTVYRSINYWVDVVFSAGGGPAPGPTLTSIAVTPTSPTITVGATQPFAATGTYSDSSTQNLTNQVAWTSANTSVATISASGLATGVSVGSTTISAALSGVTGSATLTVQSAPAPALAITTSSPLANGTVGTAYSATLAASGGTTPYTWSITAGSLPAGLTLQASTGVINGTPTTAGTYNFTVQVSDSLTGTSSKGLSITVNGSGTSCASNCTLWPSTATPSRAAATTDPNSINVGVKFKSDVSGVITGIRFYKGTTNTGTHVGALWTSTGTKLAEVTFINETASGWQQANFATPVAIAANTVYVASYLAPNGNYAFNYDYFTTKGIDTLPLHAIASNSADGPNGVYSYNVNLVAPSSTYRSINYWVDVVFSAGGGPAPGPTLTSIAVTPTSPTITVGATQPFAATGTYSDSSTQNLTNQVAWTSANTSVATISASGLATGVSVGSTTISAALSGVTGSATLTVQSAPAPALAITTSSPLANGTVGTAYSATLAASGGTTPYTWSITAGSLPAGLTLQASTGVINGTPTTAGTYNFTVQVSDSLTGTSSKDLSITIAATQGSTIGLSTKGSVLDSGDSNYLNGSKVTTSNGGTISSMSVYVGGIDALSSNQSYQLAIYTDNANKPGTLVASSATGTLTANSWNTLPINATLQPNTSYWLMYNTNGRTSTVNNMYYNNGTVGQGAYSSGSVTFETWPATFPASQLSRAIYSLHATFGP
jgi:WD40 repeat protein